MLPHHTVTALLCRERTERLAAMATPRRRGPRRSQRASTLRRALVVARFRIAGIPAPAVGRGCC